MERGSQLSLSNKLENLLDTGIIPRLVVFQFISVAKGLSYDDHLVDGESAGLPHSIVDGFSLVVSQTTLAWPSPAYTVVVIVLIEASHFSYFKTLHFRRGYSPTHPKPVTYLLQSLITSELIPFQLELGSLTRMPREFRLAFKTWLSSLSFAVSLSFSQLDLKEERLHKQNK